MAAGTMSAPRAARTSRAIPSSFDFRDAKNAAAGRMPTATLTNELDGAV
jgi:hypothetical protein